MFSLTGDAPEASAPFAHATTLLGRDPCSWVCSAGEDALQQDRTAQLLCALQAQSAAAVLADLLPQRRCVAGYSSAQGRSPLWCRMDQDRPLWPQRIARDD
jgi:[acyl-carrier-protein] S-malonyltransferase